MSIARFSAGAAPREWVEPGRRVVIDLPRHVSKGRVSLEEALALRRSCRELTPEPLTAETLSQLLWAVQGVTHADGHRTAPSAGAAYPLEVYVLTEAGSYHYEPRSHRLRGRLEKDVRPAIYRAALDQVALVDAPVVFVITGVYERTAEKYGGSRAVRYVQMEAGHAVQNLLLQAAALGLGAVTVGAFDDAALQSALSLPVDHRPLYLIPVGHPV